MAATDAAASGVSTSFAVSDECARVGWVAAPSVEAVPSSTASNSRLVGSSVFILIPSVNRVGELPSAAKSGNRIFERLARRVEFCRRKWCAVLVALWWCLRFSHVDLLFELLVVCSFNPSDEPWGARLRRADLEIVPSAPTGRQRGGQ